MVGGCKMYYFCFDRLTILGPKIVAVGKIGLLMEQLPLS